MDEKSNLCVFNLAPDVTAEQMQAVFFDPNALRVPNFRLYQLNTRPDTVELLAFLEENRGQLTGRERRMVDLLRKEGRKMERIPAEEYMAFRRLSVEANAVWRTAKEHSDFALFAPYLQKRFDMSRQIARYCAPDMDPYDFWLGDNEEGISRARCDAFFDVVYHRIIPLLQAVQSRPQLDNAIIKGHFPIPQQAVLAHKLMDILSNFAGYRPEKVILVFDAYKVAGGPGEVLRWHNIDVVFTKEAETADLYIEKTAHVLAKKYRVTVATSDAVEQIIIFGAGAFRMSARMLLEEIVFTEREMRERYGIGSDEQ